MRILYLCALAVGVAALCSSCGADLGDCDEAAAQELVYSQTGLVATKGQALLNDSCGNSAFCHSANAKGDARHGAPSSLTFDILPEPTGWPEVVRLREDIWDAVESGSMPPGGEVADKVLGNSGWSFDLRHLSDKKAKLPELSTHDGKAALRNWLACGAPVVNETKVPAWAMPKPTGDAGPAGGFEDIYQRILQPRCALAGCHNASAAGGLKMTDSCSAYSELKKSGSCGAPRVKPGDADSLLIEKVSSKMPSCGSMMPPTGQLPEGDIDALRDWVMDGAKAPSCGEKDKVSE